MRQLVLIDSNLLLLLVVGRASPAYIQMHKRLRDDYTASEYAILENLIGSFTGIAVVPHVLAELSNLARYIGEPALSAVLESLKNVVETAQEYWLESMAAMQGWEFRAFGLADAVLLRLCSKEIEDVHLTLLTADQPLAYRAQSLERPVLIWE